MFNYPYPVLNLVAKFYPISCRRVYQRSHCRIVRDGEINKVLCVRSSYQLFPVSPFLLVPVLDVVISFLLVPVLDVVSPFLFCCYLCT